MFYKITHNQTIVDVNTDTMINYVRYNKYNQSLIICESTHQDAVGIVSSDNSAIYHLVGYPEIPNVVLGEFIDVEIYEISEEDYNVFKKALDEQKEIIDPDPYIPPEPEPTPEEREAEEEYRRSLQFVKDSKIQYMSYLCNQTIVNGIDVTLSDGNMYHFSLTENDQTNLMERQAQVMSGALQVSYHADGELCTYYSAEDMMKIIQSSIFHKDYQTTYFNSLKHYINSLETMEEVSAIEYGIEIPVEYRSQPLKDLLAQIAQAQE